MTGTNATWVGEVDGNAGEVIHRQLVLAGTRDDVFVSCYEFSKGLVFALFNSCNDKRTGAILLRQVNCKA